MTALVLLFTLLLVVAATLWRSSRGGTSRTGQMANLRASLRLRRLWWPRIVTRPG